MQHASERSAALEEQRIPVANPGPGYRAIGLSRIAHSGADSVSSRTSTGVVKKHKTAMSSRSGHVVKTPHPRRTHTFAGRHAVRPVSPHIVEWVGQCFQIFPATWAALAALGMPYFDS